ncbi:MAG TPA: efflux RND transporter permease subunit, partial [Pseudomonadales bacterium]|nr:efflux RND transporter permease subunit [Pseudomonadales bacterium]
MNRLIAWFAENHVAANLLMLLLVVGGIFSLPNISKEIIPDVSLEMVVISVPYPGASPTEVEKAVLTRVESAIADIEGVKDIESTAA